MREPSSTDVSRRRHLFKGVLHVSKCFALHTLLAEIKRMGLYITVRRRHLRAAPSLVSNLAIGRPVSSAGYPRWVCGRRSGPVNPGSSQHWLAEALHVLRRSRACCGGRHQEGRPYKRRSTSFSSCCMRQFSENIFRGGQGAIRPSIYSSSSFLIVAPSPSACDDIVLQIHRPCFNVTSFQHPHLSTYTLQNIVRCTRYSIILHRSFWRLTLYVASKGLCALATVQPQTAF